MNLAGHDFLARAILAQNEDIGIGRCGTVDQRTNALHGFGIAEQRHFAIVPKLGVRPRSILASSLVRLSAAALRTVAARRSLLHGLATKSLAPRLIASTATKTAPCAVMITTAASGSMVMIRPR